MDAYLSRNSTIDYQSMIVFHVLPSADVFERISESVKSEKFQTKPDTLQVCKMEEHLS